jgi:hypothetical protein
MEAGKRHVCSYFAETAFLLFGLSPGGSTMEDGRTTACDIMTELSKTLASTTAARYLGVDDYHV